MYIMILIDGIYLGWEIEEQSFKTDNKILVIVGVGTAGTRRMSYC
jgi:hypothetical protein